MSGAAAGATRIVVIGRAGSLKVTGTGGSQIVASGTACSSDEDFLNEIKLDLRRNGSELVVEAVIPERAGIFDWMEAGLDFVVSLPSNVPLTVRDGSGELEILNVGPLEVTDGSGELRIRGVNGDVEVHDGSGSMTIENVSGNVEVSDGSGSIDIRGVGRSVRILSDGSGGIDVSDVKGDFIVDHDGSGGVSYDRVSGRVSVPRRDRDR